MFLIDMTRSYFYVALTVLFTVYGQIVIKWRVNVHALSGDKDGGALVFIFKLLLDPYVLSGLAAALMASCTWMLAVSRLELSKAYPFAAMSFVLVPIAAWLLLSEGITLKTFVGAALIVIGVAVSAS